MMRSTMTGVCALALLAAGCSSGDEPVAENGATGDISAVEGARADSGSGMTVDEVAKTMSNVKMKPGAWDVSMTIEDVKLTGLPPGPQGQQIEQMMKQSIGARTVKSCMTPEQAANPQADFLAAQEGKNCTYDGFAMDGGQVKGKMVCTPPNGKGQMTMTMNGTYSPTDYAMNMTLEGAGMGDGMAMTMKAKTQGKWLSDACPADAG